MGVWGRWWKLQRAGWAEQGEVSRQTGRDVAPPRTRSRKDKETQPRAWETSWGPKPQPNPCLVPWQRWRRVTKANPAHPPSVPLVLSSTKVKGFLPPCFPPTLHTTRCPLHLQLSPSWRLISPRRTFCPLGVHILVVPFYDDIFPFA